MGILDDLRAEGRVLLIATHDIEQARRWDRVLCLRGEQIAYGAPAETLTNAVLEATYGAELDVLDCGQRAVAVQHHHHGTRTMIEILHSGLLQRALLEIVVSARPAARSASGSCTSARRTPPSRSPTRCCRGSCSRRSPASRCSRRGRRRARGRGAHRARRARHARRLGGRRRRHRHDALRRRRPARALARRARPPRPPAVRRPAGRQHRGPRRRAAGSPRSSPPRSPRPPRARRRGFDPSRAVARLRPARVELGAAGAARRRRRRRGAGPRQPARFALLVAPAAAAMRLGRSVRAQLWLAAALGAAPACSASSRAPSSTSRPAGRSPSRPSRSTRRRAVPPGAPRGGARRSRWRRSALRAEALRGGAGRLGAAGVPPQPPAPGASAARPRPPRASPRGSQLGLGQPGEHLVVAAHELHQEALAAGQHEVEANSTPGPKRRAPPQPPRAQAHGERLVDRRRMDVSVVGTMPSG